MAFNAHIQELKNNQEKAITRTGENCIKMFGNNLSSNVPFYNETLKSFMCPPFFDELYCWPPQPPNTTASVPCPQYVLGFIKTQNATRRCTENGTWFVKSENSTYTNYSTCYNGSLTTIFTNMSKSNDAMEVSEDSLDLIKILSETGYAVSLISLIIALITMLIIKKLHCARNILHMNLFASFILRCYMQILKDIIFVDGLALSKDLTHHNGSKYFHIDATSNNYECKLVSSLVQYFTAANYAWILMEGLYLNNLILRALFTDSNKNLVYYIVFGWGLPLFVVVPWVVARLLFEDTLCWTTHENSKVYAIIIIPTLTSVLLNLVLFVIISMVLYTKLKSPVNDDSRRYLKWAKSTLVLVPLFGVNYAAFLVLYLLNQKFIWMTCDRLFGSFQGFFVAILYCFLNGEVKSELKPHIHSVLIYLATNSVTKFCFPGREKYLSSAGGRQSVCTTLSCSSLYNNGVSRRNSQTKSKFDQLSKVKLTNLHTDNLKDSILPHSVNNSIPKNVLTGHYEFNMAYVNGKYPAQMTTNLDSSLSNERPHHHYSQNLPTCEEEVCMLEICNVKCNLEFSDNK